jgi:urease accessory protein
MKQPPQAWVVVLLAAAAGLFHGYAYGEAVVGAEMAPLFAYLLGFAAIQMGIALASYGIARRLGYGSESGALNLRFAGFTLAGVGAAFLSGVVLG